METRRLLLAAAVILLAYQATPGPLLPASGGNLLELSARPWLYNLSLAAGRSVALADVPDAELDRIAGLGFDMVWLIGVWSLGEYGLNFDRTDAGLLAHYAQVLPGFTQDDIIGSPYAVTEYVINPPIGSGAAPA